MGADNDLNLNANDANSSYVNRCPYEIPQFVEVDAKTARLLEGLCCVGDCDHAQFGYWCDCYYGGNDRGLDSVPKWWWTPESSYVGVDYYKFLLGFISWCEQNHIDLENHRSWCQGQCEYVSDQFYEKYCSFLSRQRLSVVLQTRMFRQSFNPISVQGNFLPLPPNMTMPVALFY